jgi:tetratricopeptide (TPR) repeat protein
MMNRINTVTVIASMTLLLGIAACSGPSKRGIEARAAAKSRFDAVRSRVDYDQADQAFRAGDFVTAKNHLDAAIQKVDNDANYWVLLGRVYLEDGSLGDAATSFDKAHEIDAQNADACYFQGIVDQRLNRGKDAVEHYLDAHEIAPSNTGMLVAAVDTLIGEGEFDEADRVLREKRSGFTGAAAIHHLSGRVAMLKGRWNEAVDHLERAVLLDDKDRWTLEDLARAQLSAHRTGDCLQTIDRLVAISEAGDQDRELMRMRGRCLAAGERYREAREVFLDFTNLNPEDSEGWVDFGLMCLEVEDYRRVVRAGQRLVVLEPNEFEGYFLLGQAAMREKEYVTAATLFKRAADVAPDRDEPKLALGMAYELQGEYAAAYRVYAGLMKANPEDHRVRHLLTGVGEQLD